MEHKAPYNAAATGTEPAPAPTRLPYEEWDNEQLGDLVKKIAQTIKSNNGSATIAAAASILAASLAEDPAIGQSVTLTVPNITLGGKHDHDWEITVNKKLKR